MGPEGSCEDPDARVSGRIAWETGDPVGFALAIGLGGECEVVALGVAPERRQAGMGTILLKSICNESRNIGARSVVLEVAADNVAARALYARNGFVQAGRRRNYYRRRGTSIDALVLRLTFPGRAASALNSAGADALSFAVSSRDRIRLPAPGLPKNGD